MKTKICSKCKKRKEINKFYKDSSKKDELYSSCKNCEKIGNQRNWHLNKKRLQESSKKYYQKNKFKIIQRVGKYYNKNKKLINKKKKLYYEKNIDKFRELHRKYRENNKSKFAIYFKNRRKIDIGFKLIGNLRSRLTKLLKRSSKSKTTIKLIGCSIGFLKQHLKEQFKKGMSFQNYGKWHVDHIKTCASFDLTKPEEQQKCFHYTNLRPLWAEENLRRPRK